MNMFVITLAWIALLIVIYVVIRRYAGPSSVDDALAEINPVDVEAFENLFAEDDLAFLRATLGPRDFRRIQRMRVAAALQYLRRVAHNASVLARVAHVAEDSGEAAAAASGRHLAQVATSVQFQSMQLMLRLCVLWAIPGSTVPSFSALDAYQQLKREFATYGARHNSRAMAKLYAAL